MAATITDPNPALFCQYLRKRQPGNVDSGAEQDCKHEMSKQQHRQQQQRRPSPNAPRIQLPQAVSSPRAWKTSNDSPLPHRLSPGKAAASKAAAVRSPRGQPQQQQQQLGQSKSMRRPPVPWLSLPVPPADLPMVDETPGSDADGEAAAAGSDGDDGSAARHRPMTAGMYGLNAPNPVGVHDWPFRSLVPS